MPKPRSKQQHRCARCNRKLKHQRWIYSRHTGNRYCYLGEGCNRVKGGEHAT